MYEFNRDAHTSAVAVVIPNTKVGIMPHLATSYAGQPTVPLCDRSSSINPPHTLTVTPGEPAILTCTTACQDVNNVYFVVPDTQNDILRASKFDRIHGSVNFTTNEENCSYSVDFYFTQDEQTIRDLHSVQCVFTGSTPCRTDIVSVIFAGMQRVITITVLFQP